MKKISIFLLLLLIIPSCLLFNGCNKNSTKILSNYYQRYLEISSSNDFLIEIDMPAQFSASNNQKIIGFKYSTKLENKISTIPAFSHITSLYNVMLNDSLSGLYLYGDYLNGLKLNKNTATHLENSLNELKINLNEIALRVSDLENNQDSETANSSLAKLYISYNKAIITGINISNNIYDIYFDKIMINFNTNYAIMNAEDVNLENMAIKTLNRLSYYKMVYLDIFMQTTVLPENMAYGLIDGSFSNYYEPYNNLKDKSYSTTINSNLELNRTELVNLARTLYNIQLSFKNEYNSFKNSIKNINYSTTNETSSVKEIAHKTIIDRFIGNNGIAFVSYKTIDKILSLCY